MSTGFVKVIKQAALDVMENQQMCDLRYGTVVSESPLKIKITNLFTIPSSMLVVPKHLTDYKVNISEEETKDKKTMIVHNALKVGDKVALLRKQGGQSYFILDKI
jgi:hypothetical protein